ncbi:MFS transporter [Streptacidiphilus fuscans]|uniref:MFS transporter n=1 Tax=Streptacidiphilus fuscans TaxID=2789292 RepID=A0A931FCG9_9ACTN|nr:MFS transporter [Streptacidiphilus fuscans]MBF9069722.1 MFS transporter [Streptacidiphilus fuscans]
MPRTVRLLLLARVVNQLGAFSLPFLTVLISTDYRASVTTAGLVSAAFGLATIPSRLAGGRLAERVGRSGAIALGLVGCAVAQLGIAASRSLAAVVVWAVLLGLAFELYEPPSQALIAEAVPQALRVRAFGWFSAALALGGMGAGVLAAWLGRFDLRWLFVADAATCLACAALVQLALPGHRRPLREPAGVAERSVDSPVRPWQDRALLTMLATGTVYALVNQQTLMTLPLSLARHGLPPADAGLLFTASAATTVAAQPLLRIRRLSSLSAPVALALGQLLLAAGLLGYALGGSLLLGVVASAVWSLGNLLTMGRAYALVADLAPPGGADRYLAVFGISWGVSATLAPILGTQLLAHYGTTVLWGTTAAACLALAVVHLRLTTAALRPALSVPGSVSPTI